MAEMSGRIYGKRRGTSIHWYLFFCLLPTLGALPGLPFYAACSGHLMMPWEAFA